MKTQKLIITSLVIVFSSLLLIKPLLAQHHGCKGHEQPPKSHECFIEGLTDEQKSKIEKIKLDSDKKIQELKAELKIKDAELDKMIIADNPDKKAIDKKIDEISVIKASIQKERTAAHLAIRSELTPEQKIKFDRHHQMRNKQMHNFHDGEQHPGCRNMSAPNPLKHE
ncbi:MAG: Spy/CpxP family protein refolding chaperone [Bacteroidales bacterium]|jgi:Spy/CpxP family protein refolding chaperone|nr:Spy/CpxP family protein refolding chaperone [Bacteroidales bacterium]HOL98918.1 Spy/CpxP family protein refolding chaperone [Bacteroidales bacterium]HOM36900.1 Spy/CpxP family protein refolding chaperone [Bacteroidales bacterium]HPD24220.1 Spy/CpxP family protein refolding chaperone [Bacteroidales bacterium]HRS99905.1 Spy/CpxP family protein refolding chaperone [Bacteroidales bacterium]